MGMAPEAGAIAWNTVQPANAVFFTDRFNDSLWCALLTTIRNRPSDEVEE